MQSNRMTVQAGVALAARKALSVERAVTDLNSALEDLHDAVSLHADVLQPLLAACPAEACAEPRPEGECEVAERILSRAEGIRDAAKRIRNLTDRL